MIRKYLWFVAFATCTVSASVAFSQENSKLSKAATSRMQQMESNYKRYYGSKSDTSLSRTGLTVTDCFRFTRDVLYHAFGQVAATKHQVAVQKYYKDGGDLAKYLVEKAGWSSWYWNPDVRHPGDGWDEHRYYARQAGREKKHFYNDARINPNSFVPIQNYLVNYDPVPKDWFELDPSSTESINFRTTKADSLAVDYIRNAPLCFGITEGSLHTFILSKGEVHEVHLHQHGLTAMPPRSDAKWTDKLFDVRDFFGSFSNYRSGGWLSGVLVCAPTSTPIPQGSNEYRLG